jgi:hypothetical protein
MTKAKASCLARAGFVRAAAVEEPLNISMNGSSSPLRECFGLAGLAFAFGLPTPPATAQACP